MRRILPPAAIVLAAFGLTSCATMTVSSHMQPGMDLTPYHTFAWGPADALPTGDPRLDQNPFFKDHVEGAVERELTRTGFELTAAAAPPDLLIHYHASITQRLDVNRADSGYGYCANGDCPVDIVTYEAGTLVLDIVDARSHRLLWRGWAQNSVEDLLDNPDRMADTITQAVTRMLQRLPRRLGQL